MPEAGRESGDQARWSDLIVRQGMAEMMVTVQSKNWPAISFLQRNGFRFCGYNERFYRNQDIALYFVCGL